MGGSVAPPTGTSPLHLSDDRGFPSLVANLICEFNFFFAIKKNKLTCWNVPFVLSLLVTVDMRVNDLKRGEEKE